MTIQIKLTTEEIMIGALEGIMRHTRALKTGRTGVNQQPQHLQWQVKIEGALAEIAVAKALDIYWHGASKRGSADAGKYEVRMTRYPTGSLFLHPHDKDSAKFILVCGLNGDYKIPGWILGKDGKQQKYWRKVNEKREAAYFVPQEALHPIDTL